MDQTAANRILIPTAKDKEVLQEIAAVATLVLVGMLAPDPWGVRFGALILFAYIMTHPATFSAITNAFQSGFTVWQQGTGQNPVRTY